MDEDLQAAFESARVFCNEELLRVVQLSPWRPHTDSKTFVDRPLKQSPSEVLDAFKSMSKNPSESELISFLDGNFCSNPESLSVVVDHMPTDFTEEPPSFLRSVKCSNMETFCIALKSIWPRLCRAFDKRQLSSGSEDKLEGDEIAPISRSSLFSLPYPFFVPGGRFRECYYWDSLWIVHGLVASDMLVSAKNVVCNLLSMVRKFGFVPNGNRVYYLSRSQPPVLPEAVNVIYNAILDESERIEWLKEALPLLEKEYRAFLNYRTEEAIPVPDRSGEKVSLAAYRVKTSLPRPEAYKEDYNTNLRYQGLQIHNNIYSSQDRSSHASSDLFQDLASGAESGWDFSTRWFFDRKSGIESIRTSEIIPCCLNSFLLRNEKLLSKFHRILLEAASCGRYQGSDENPISFHSSASEAYKVAAERRAKAMMQLFWNPKSRVWVDFDLRRRRKSDVIAASGYMPLWAECWDSSWSITDAEKIVDNLMNHSGLLLPGGISVAAHPSKEQWDYPNSWPPITDMVVTGLKNLERKFPGCGAEAAAEEIAMRTLRAMYQEWKASATMHEKYDASYPLGRRGKGGEYTPQTGFGWSNGVALKLMKEYSAEISSAAEGRWFS